MKVHELFVLLAKLDPELPVYMGDDPEVVADAYVTSDPADPGEQWVQLAGPGEADQDPQAENPFSDQS